MQITRENLCTDLLLYAINNNCNPYGIFLICILIDKNWALKALYKVQSIIINAKYVEFSKRAINKVPRYQQKYATVHKDEVKMPGRMDKRITS